MTRALLTSLALPWLLAVESLASGPPPLVPTSADLPVLVRQLGDESYEKREHAVRLLAFVGKPALAALQVGLKDPDAEVRRRCARLVKVIGRPDMDPRLVALVGGKDRFEPPLPGWERFREVAGNGASARALYVEIYTKDRPLLEALQNKPTELVAQLNVRATQVQQRIWGNQPNAKPVELWEVAALFLVATQGSNDTSRYYVVQNLFYQQLVRNFVETSPALRRMISQYLERRGTDIGLLVQTAMMAKQLNLTDLIEKLKPLALRRLEDSILRSPTTEKQPDLNQLYQAAQAIANLGIQDSVPEAVRKAVRQQTEAQVAKSLDLTNAYQIVYTLQSLRMQETLDTVYKPALRKLVLGLPKERFEFYRIYQAHNLCQMIGASDLNEELKPIICQKITDVINSGDVQQLNETFNLTQYIDLREAREGLIKPAVRRQLVAFLEQPGDLNRLAQLTGQASQVEMPEVGELVRPFLRQRAQMLIDKPEGIAVVQQLYQIAQSVSAGDVIDKQIKPALQRALVAALDKPVDQNNLYQTLNLACQLNVKEGAALAVKAALDTKVNAGTRAYAVSSIGILGSAEHAKQLEPLLSNNTNVGAYYVNGAVVQAQLRDVALAAMVHLTKQNLTEYGFGQMAQFARNGYIPPPSYFGLKSDKERTDGLARWKKWSAAKKK